VALSERTFGPLLDGSSVYLDTAVSQWLDATSGEGLLHVPGGDFVLEAEYSRLGPDYTGSFCVYSGFWLLLRPVGVLLHMVR
jgi:hypothetical protein